MGIIHKLHPDVVEFILSSKMSDPSLGCRQLAEVVQSRLGIKVSKSSVNNLLKAASLSDSVGRKQLRLKSVKSSPKLSEIAKDTFAIPPLKKQQISKNLENTKDFVSSPAIMDSSTRENTGVPIKSMNSKSLEDIHSTSWLAKRASFNKIIFSDEQNVFEKDSIASGMGLIFLKAAQWLTTSRSIWPQVFKEPSDLPSSELAAYWETRFLSRTAGEDFKEHAIWSLNDNVTIMTEIEKSRISDVFDFLVYEVEAQMAASQVSAIQVFLKNGQSFWMDPQMISTQEDFEGCVSFGLPLAQTIKMISNRWIAHQRSIIFFTSPEINHVEDVFRLHDTCEGRAGFEISSMIVFDHQKKALFESIIIPEQKRIYIMGLWPWRAEACFWMPQDQEDVTSQHDQFSNVFQKRHVDEIKTCYLSQLRSEVVFKDYDIVVTEKNGFSRKQRSIVIFQQSRMLWGILTNDLDSAPERLIESYLKRWPNGDHFLFEDLKYCAISGHEGLKRSDIVSDLCEQDDGKPEMNLIFDHFWAILWNVTKQTFFRPRLNVIIEEKDVREMMKIPGFMRVSENNVRVFLQSQLSNPLRKSLVAAVGALNEMDVLDHRGRNVRVYIDFI